MISGYSNLISELLKAPRVAENTREILNATMFFPAVFMNFPSRNLDLGYFAVLFLWYLHGDQDATYMANVSPEWKSKIGDCHSNYGQYVWFENQFNVAIDRLTSDPASRQAVILFNRPSVSCSSTRDHICTTSLQFLIRDNRLCVICTMRSNDLISGTTYDVPFFKILHMMAYAVLKARLPGLTLGPYYHNVGSMHFYLRDYVMVRKMSTETLQPVVMPFPTLDDVKNMPYVPLHPNNFVVPPGTALIPWLVTHAKIKLYGNKSTSNTRA